MLNWHFRIFERPTIITTSNKRKLFLTWSINFKIEFLWIYFVLVKIINTVSIFYFFKTDKNWFERWFGHWEISFSKFLILFSYFLSCLLKFILVWLQNPYVINHLYYFSQFINDIPMSINTRNLSHLAKLWKMFLNIFLIATFDIG